MIPFHRPTRAPGELGLMSEALLGDYDEDHFNRQGAGLLQSRLDVAYATLTPSCTDALELAALALEIQPGDEVIVPAFTFSSTANAFLLRGARLVFADVSPDTLNIDPTRVAALITPRTRAIVVMHYAGIACDMDAILAAAGKIPVIEDAAHALFGAYRGRALGTLGTASAFSFHRTKNLTCEEGGAFVTNDGRLAGVAEIIREKGTNRAAFMRGAVQKYEWVRTGSSFILAETLAARLCAQLRHADEIQARRRRIFERYQEGLADWAAANGVVQPTVQEGCEPAWHLYYLVMPSEEARDRLLYHLGTRQIGSALHYVPLHLTPMGRRLGARPGDAPVSERAASRLLRLPFFTDLAQEDQDRVIDVVGAFQARRLRPARVSRFAEQPGLH
jgi:dTDP-4-amino-4,6-dideoxygalactose transaminase